MAYMQVMDLWGIGRSDWASCLGVEYSTLTTWQSTGLFSFGIVPRTRIVALLFMRDILHQVSDHRKNSREYVQRSQSWLNGRAIVDAIKFGNVLDALSALQENPKMPSHRGPKGMLPIIPTDILRLETQLVEFLDSLDD
jgi:hypothetical protein